MPRRDVIPVDEHTLSQWIEEAVRSNGRRQELAEVLDSLGIPSLF